MAPTADSARTLIRSDIADHSTKESEEDDIESQSIGNLLADDSHDSATCRWGLTGPKYEALGTI